MQSVIVAGVGHSVPAKILKNEDFPAMGVDTSDEWIHTRTGIRERRICGENETIISMALASANMALERAKLEAKDIELIVVATLTPERVMPSTACVVQSKLGLEDIPAFDVSAACSGFLYSMNVAEGLMRARGYKTALVIGAEKLSSVVDWKDRTTCILFGDGAGAAVLRASDEPKIGLLDSILGANGSVGELLTLKQEGFLCMNGKEVFKLAVTVMLDSATKLLERNNLSKDDLALVIPHQANNRIIEAVAERLKLPMDKFFVNVEKYGNTSAASIPIALSEAAAAGKLKKGDLLLLIAFGGGLTWGASLIRWN